MKFGYLCAFFFFLKRIIQENGFGNDQNSNIIVALTFYELWYSTIPKELLRTELNRISTPSRSYDRPIYLEGSDQSNNTVASAGFHPDSSSVQNYKMLAANCDDGTNRDNPIGVDSIQKVENISQNNQIEGFYVNSTDNTGNETSISNRADALPYGSLSVLGEYSILSSFCLCLEEMIFCLEYSSLVWCSRFPTPPLVFSLGSILKFCPKGSLSE